MVAVKLERLIFLLAVAATSSVSGCKSFQTKQPSSHLHHCQTPTKPAIVDVGGQVASPARLEIGDDGLNLRRALTLVGGLQGGAVQSTIAPGAPPNLAQWQQAIETAGTLSQRVTLLHNNDQLPAVEAKALKDEIDQAHKLADSFQGGFNIDPETYKDLRTEIFQLAGAKEEVTNPASSKAGRDKRAAEIPSLQQKVNEGIKKLSSTTVPVNVSAAPDSGTFLVGISRQVNNTPTTHYFPYDLSLTGAAGEIKLQAGDLIQVVDYRRTSLGPNATNAGGIGGATIQGFVRNPGTVPTGVPFIKNALSNAQPAFPDDNAVLLVQRTSPDGLGQDVFVLPRGAVESGAMANSRILSGDLYHYTTLAQSPLVLQSLVEKALRAPSASAAKSKLAARGTPKPGSLKDRCQQHRQQAIGQSGDVASRLRRNVAGAGETIRARLGANLPVR